MNRSTVTDALTITWKQLGQTGPESALPVALPDLYEASIAELQDGLTKGHFTSVDLAKAYLARIDEVNNKGPALHAVIETNPNILRQAAALDAERAQGSRGPLHGIPILLKDNIATDHSEGMETTAGSLALIGAIPPRAAHVVSRLQSAGALLLGKANLSEWANFRGTVPQGFSARGGQTTCPYLPLASPSGSSGGSAVASAIGLAAATLGSETDGSIVSPGSRNNIVGLKPTVGWASRAGVIPIARAQDTVGPMARCVADVAVLMGAIAGRDERDEATLLQPEEVPDFVGLLAEDGLRGVRLGVPRSLVAGDEYMVAAFEEAVEVVKRLGAVVIDPAEFPDPEAMRNAKEKEMLVLYTEFKVGVEEYIAELTSVPTGVKTLADLIQFNIDHADKELAPPHYTSQSRFLTCQETSPDAAYLTALSESQELGRRRGIDAVLEEYGLDAILLPTDGKSSPGCATSTPAAIAGYPIVTVPLGFQPDSRVADAATPIIKDGPGLPFGLAFVGTAWSDAQLLRYAYAFEQATRTRRRRRAYDAAVPKTQLADVMGRAGV
ncbi:amidase signature enzyme [Artomyces pyxidatus]|uniref:Amidase signature enzyme n=1 Tax=Artomyces pyxidatus TaxID=48021 RepID=A0ACB8SY56_9AGAM|nr:amidase signature enzyme [Artomyces pyxidatus]